MPPKLGPYASGRNYSKRALGLLLCFAVPLLFAASFAWGRIHPGHATFAAAWWLAPGGCIVALNVYLAFLRPWFFQLRGGARSKYTHVSGIPLLGTLALLPALNYGWGAAGTSLVGVGLSLLDFGGPMWFLIWTWREGALWDQPWREPPPFRRTPLADPEGTDSANVR